MKPKNRNIEVLAPDLWALRFSFIPYMADDFNMGDMDMNALIENPFWIASDGILLLNKDHKGYQMLKKVFPRLVAEKTRKLKREKDHLLNKVSPTPTQMLRATAITAEITRRQYVDLERKGAKVWQH